MVGNAALRGHRTSCLQEIKMDVGRFDEFVYKKDFSKSYCEPFIFEFWGIIDYTVL